MLPEVRHYLIDYSERCQVELTALADQDSDEAQHLRDQIHSADLLCDQLTPRRQPFIGPTKSFIERRVRELEAELKAAASSIEEIDQAEVASAVGDSMTKGLELQAAKKCLLLLATKQ